MSWWRQLAIVWHRDVVLWGRGGGRLGAMVATGLLVAVAFSLAFVSLLAQARGVLGGLLWLSLLLVGLPGMLRSVRDEWENGAGDGFLACGGDAAALFYGKALANVTGLLAAECVLLPAFLLFFQASPAGGWWDLGVTMILATIGFGFAGTLLASVVDRAAGGRAQAVQPLVALPLLVPVLLGASELVQEVVSTGQAPGAGVWWALLGAYALLFAALPYLLFPLTVTG